MASDRKKFRNVDFTHEEFCKHFGMNERTFTNRFNRFCTIYGFEKSQFKRNNEEDDVYFWPAEWAELAGVLIKAVKDNPCSRKNYNKQGITSDKICDYYKKLIGAAEKKLPPHIKSVINALPSFYEAKLTVAKMPILEDKIGELAAFYLEESFDAPGDLLSYLSSRIDLWLYNFYYFTSTASEIKASSKENSIEVLEQCKKHAKSYEDFVGINDQQRKVFLEPIKFTPLSLDVEMANLIKDAMEFTKEMQFWQEESYKRWDMLLKNYGNNKETKENIAKMIRMLLDTDEIDQEDYKKSSDLRRTYYEILDEMCIFIDYIPKVKSRFLIEHLDEKLASSKTFYEKNAAKLEKMYEESINKELAFAETIEYGEGYKEFADRLKENATKYKKATQYFLGQLILPQFTNGRNDLK